VNAGALTKATRSSSEKSLYPPAAPASVKATEPNVSPIAPLDLGSRVILPRGAALIVRGAGLESINGYYKLDGFYNERPQYKKVTV
jgi:hypothetical protein